MSERSTCKIKFPQEQIDLMVSELLAALKASVFELNEACSSCLKRAAHMPPTNCECRGIITQCKIIEKDLSDLNELCTGGVEAFCLTVEYIDADKGLTGRNRALLHDVVNGIRELFTQLSFAKEIWRTQLQFLWSIVRRKVTDAHWEAGWGISEVLLEGGHIIYEGRWVGSAIERLEHAK